MDDLLNCACCGQLLDSPIILPCSHTVCRIHETKAIESESMQVKCRECKTFHQILNRESRFPSNLIVDKLILREFHLFNFGSKHSEAKQSCNEFESLINEFQRFKNDSSFEINRVISDLKNKIDLKREELKSEIDQKALDLLKQLDEFERECQDVNTQKLETRQNDALKLSSLDCEARKKQLNLFTTSAKKWKEIDNVCKAKTKTLKAEFEEFKQHLFLDRLEKYVLKQNRFCREGEGWLL